MDRKLSLLIPSLEGRPLRYDCDSRSPAQLGIVHDFHECDRKARNVRAMQFRVSLALDLLGFGNLLAKGAEVTTPTAKAVSPAISV